MGNPDDRFSFPFPGEEAGKKPTVELPTFPAPAPSAGTGVPAAGEGGGALSAADLDDLRTLLGLFGPRWVRRFASGAAPEAGPLPAGAASQFDRTAAPASPTMPGVAETGTAGLLPPATGMESQMRAHLLRWLEHRTGGDGPEHDANQALRRILSMIDDFTAFLNAFQAVTATFPAAHALRFGTPEQKQYALTVLTDRSLEMLRGAAFAERPRLVKLLAAWATGVSGTHTFLAGEGEPCDNRHWERVAGSSSTNKTIRETQGFLVIRTDTKQVVRLGRAFT